MTSHFTTLCNPTLKTLNDVKSAVAIMATDDLDLQSLIPPPPHYNNNVKYQTKILEY